MFEWSVQNSFEIALTAAVLVVGAMFLEACWRAATDDLIASDKWIKSELSAIKDEEIRTLLKELLIDHTGWQAKALTRSIRSAERRAGKECFSMCSSRWSPYH